MQFNKADMALSALAAALACGVSASAAAQEAGSKISGSFGVDFTSHFISYGSDVWGGGSDFFGSQHTTFAYFDVGVDLPEGFSANFGAWSDINNNATGATVGGDIQEIDVYAGISYAIGIASFGATYQEWNYGGATAERILDLSAGLDDSEMWGNGFALNPGLTVHMRVGSGLGFEEGEVYVLSVGPGFSAGPVDISVPVSVAYFSSDYYGPDIDSGYGYSSAGLSASMPIAFIPPAYGDWGVSVSTTYYMTDEETIPGNPEEDFLVTMFSLGLSY